MEQLLTELSADTRKKVYTATIAAGTALGAINVAFLAAAGSIPTWLAVLNAVALFLGVPTQASISRANVPDTEDVPLTVE
jgi:hypothetical protein